MLPYFLLNKLHSALISTFKWDTIHPCSKSCNQSANCQGLMSEKIYPKATNKAMMKMCYSGFEKWCFHFKKAKKKSQSLWNHSVCLAGVLVGNAHCVCNDEHPWNYKAQNMSRTFAHYSLMRASVYVTIQYKLSDIEL